MTEQPYGENPVSKLQPLDFRLLLDDGKAAVYQALTVDYEHPGVPVYTVTVTIASAVRREAEKQLQAFLGEMKAAFALLPEPPPDDDPPDDKDEFDIETQMRIELNLVSIRGLKDDELVGVVAIVETTIGPERDTSGSDVAEDGSRKRRQSGLPHRTPRARRERPVLVGVLQPPAGRDGEALGRRRDDEAVEEGTRGQKVALGQSGHPDEREADHRAQCRTAWPMPSADPSRPARRP